MTLMVKRAILIFILSASAMAAYFILFQKSQEVLPPKPKEQGDNGNKMAQVVTLVGVDGIKNV